VIPATFGAVHLAGRALLCSLLVLAAAPSGASAATVAREGSEIVFRAAQGEADRLRMDASSYGPTVRFFDYSDAAVVTPGAGCAREPLRENARPGGDLPGADAACDASGITGVRILAGDGDDDVTVAGNLPVDVDLGAGDDMAGWAISEQMHYAIGVTADSDDLPAAIVAGGDGNDRIEIAAIAAVLRGDAGSDVLIGAQTEGPPGAWSMDGGAGDDSLTETTQSARVRMSGGPGDDGIFAQDDTVDEVTCGPGADRTTLDFADRPNRSCAPHLSHVKGAFGRFAGGRVRLVAGRLTRAAKVRVRLLRRDGIRARETLARGRLELTKGRLRGSLKVPGKGAARLRKRATQPIFVKTEIRGRGGDRETGYFRSWLR
jgi:hypothetical protein